MRHAEAEAGPNDRERALTTDGREDIKHLARFVTASGWTIGDLRSSPLKRACQSRELLQEELGRWGALAQNFSQSTDDRLQPGFRQEEAMEILGEIAPEACSLWIFHAPDIAYISSFFTNVKADNYYFTPGSMLALNLNAQDISLIAMHLWHCQPYILRKLFRNES